MPSSLDSKNKKATGSLVCKSFFILCVCVSNMFNITHTCPATGAFYILLKAYMCP